LRITSPRLVATVLRDARDGRRAHAHARATQVGAGAQVAIIARGAVGSGHRLAGPIGGHATAHVAIVVDPAARDRGPRLTAALDQVAGLEAVARVGVITVGVHLARAGRDVGDTAAHRLDTRID
jgi:hypothetical protein